MIRVFLLNVILIVSAYRDANYHHHDYDYDMGGGAMCGINEMPAEYRTSPCEKVCTNPISQICDGSYAEIQCVCKKGFLLNRRNGKCIPESACPYIPNKCSANEEWKSPPTFCPQNDTCDKLMSLNPMRGCIAPNLLPPGRCECKQGYVRLDGRCVLPSMCCKGPNEEFVSCPNPCLGGTCDKPKFSQCDIPCAPFGCQCKEGYVRDENNKCVLPAECETECGEHEVWKSPPTFCPRNDTCQKLISGPMPGCINPDFLPVGKCECIEGYAKLYDKCVPVAECCSGANEELVSCPNPCEGGTCDNPEFSQCSLPCKPFGCQCKAGFVKDNDDICIPKQQCRCSDPNEELVSCPNPCAGGTCDLPYFDNCQIRCKPLGCQCKPGFVRNTEQACVPKSACRIPCGKNEFWQSPPPCTTDDTCFKVLSPVPLVGCRNPRSLPVGECRCLPGFVRENGSCVPSSVCCNDENAEVVSCPNPCPGGTCQQPNTIPCGLPCKRSGCVCKKGFLRLLEKCVLPSKCPKS